MCKFQFMWKSSQILIGGEFSLFLIEKVSSDNMRTTAELHILNLFQGLGLEKKKQINCKPGERK